MTGSLHEPRTNAGLLHAASGLFPKRDPGDSAYAVPLCQVHLASEAPDEPVLLLGTILRLSTNLRILDVSPNSTADMDPSIISLAHQARHVLN